MTRNNDICKDCGHIRDAHGGLIGGSCSAHINIYQNGAFGSLIDYTYTCPCQHFKSLDD